MALVTTPGAANANSFASLAEFDAYHATRIPAITWLATATDPQKEAVLIMGARLLGTCFDWRGAAVDDVQALVFPRSGLLTRNGFTLPSSGATSIAIDLKNAQCEWAGQIGAADLVSDNAAASQGVESVKAGSVSVSFQKVDTSSVESVDMILRRLGSQFAYLSSEVPGEVRRLLVPSWYKQPSIKRRLLLKVF
jgi:hypothetical protein